MGIAVILALLGTLLVGIGLALFFPSAPQVPILSEGDWPLLITMFLGAGWTLLGTIQFMRFGKGFMAKAMLILMLLVSLGGTGLGAWWVLDFSYQLPAPIDLPADKPAPAFELPDQNGHTVSDISLRGKPVILIFGRGVW
ncbi:MAG: hypothetical protein KDB90_13800 [Planctomycetes bacterium]|nr:hypothetical protein [Planctomycetota bacterium]